ncbi:hypothetical protein XENOCAPTIV_014412 [Xenoophorus captivus]|uniref:Secreted protein n=1 Tax=Xenoophorus captivus TaxID=1517983 RepID=A0ABV0RC83_9TELE
MIKESTRLCLLLPPSPFPSETQVTVSPPLSLLLLVCLGVCPPFFSACDQSRSTRTDMTQRIQSLQAPFLYFFSSSSSYSSCVLSLSPFTQQSNGETYKHKHSLSSTK